MSGPGVGPVEARQRDDQAAGQQQRGEQCGDAAGGSSLGETGASDHDERERSLHPGRKPVERQQEQPGGQRDQDSTPAGAGKAGEGVAGHGQQQRPPQRRAELAAQPGKGASSAELMPLSTRPNQRNK